MEITLEKDIPVAHVRLAVPLTNHARIQQVKRLLSVKQNQDVNLVDIYLKAIEKGLPQLEKEAA